MKGKSHPEIYILLERKWTPKEIINLGYSKSTVYKYNSRFKDALKHLKELMQK